MSNIKEQVIEFIFIFKVVAWSYKHSSTYPSVWKTDPWGMRYKAN